MIFKSASKIVFIWLAFIAGVAFLYGIFTGTVSLETEHFMSLASLAFGFYFAYKPTDSNGEINK